MTSNRASVNESAADVLNLLLAVSTLLTEDTSNFAAREGMTPARLHLLWVLAAEGATQPHLLASHLGVAARTVTGLVDRLVESGHVARAPHPEDRRSTLVTLTPQGKAFGERLRQMRADLARQLFETMPDNRVSALREDLEVVLGRLQHLLDA
jgi:DNA-binding MarR family transcriptional regulator